MISRYSNMAGISKSIPTCRKHGSSCQAPEGAATKLGLLAAHVFPLLASERPTDLSSSAALCYLLIHLCPLPAITDPSRLSPAPSMLLPAPCPPGPELASVAEGLPNLCLQIGPLPWMPDRRPHLSAQRLLRQLPDLQAPKPCLSPPPPQSAHSPATGKGTAFSQHSLSTQHVPPHSARLKTPLVS